MSDINQLIQEIKELTDTVKDHRPAPATLDMDTIKAEFQGQIDTLVEQRIKEAQDKQPQRRQAGKPVGPDLQSAPLKANRYARMLKNFAAGGYHPIGTMKAKPIDLWIADLMMTKGHALMPDRAPLPSDDLKNALKALTSTGSGTGDELVPTNMAAELWDDIFLSSRVAAILPTIEMPTNPFDVPLGLGDVTWYKGTENTATTASDPATAKSTLTCTELLTEQNWSYTLNEDAVVAMAPAIRNRLAISAAEIVDDFALNADATNAGTGNINLDDADPADTKYYLSAGQDGIRHQWLIDNTSQNVNAGGDALTDTDVVSALKTMGKYAVDPNQAVIVCDVSTYLKGFLNLTGVVTVDKFGPEAVLLTGQLAAYRGIPVVISASHPLAEADGKVSTTAGNNTLGSISLFNRNMWYLGFRRRILIEVDRAIQKRQFIMVTSLREAIAAHGTRSTNTHTAGIRNISVA